MSRGGHLLCSFRARGVVLSRVERLSAVGRRDEVKDLKSAPSVWGQ